MAPGLRLSAADRPGVAQPVPERDIPQKPWRRIATLVFALTAALTCIWEWQMRRQELILNDFGYSIPAWAEQRHRIDTASPAEAADLVAIVGDSRILYDTDLDRFQQLTNRRPIQLALPGTNALPFLEDLARDPKFRGTLIVGISDMSYFRERIGLMQKALATSNWESPADLGSFRIFGELNQFMVMLDDDYRLSRLVRRLDRGLRPSADSPYDDPWKIGNLLPGRQTMLWPRIEHDKFLREHARFAWHGFAGPPIGAALIASTFERTRVAVAAIRARGGDVAFIHPPSAPQLRVNEDKRLPRAKGWDALLASAEVQGVHSDDLPAAQGLTLPEWSHLNHACAAVFTDAYIRKLAEIFPRLKLNGAAPASLSTKDCL